jgi:hypothetical protein
MGRPWLSIAVAVWVCLALARTAGAQHRLSEGDIASAKARGETAADSDWLDAKRSTSTLEDALNKMNQAFACHKMRVLSPDAFETSLSHYCKDHGWSNNITEMGELIGYSNRFWALATAARRH